MDRTRRGWSWIVAVLVALPLVYVLSFGPACWITSRTNLNHNVINVLYGPLLWAFANGPDWFRVPIYDYAHYASTDRWGLTVAKYRGRDVTIWTQEKPLIGTQLVLE